MDCFASLAMTAGAMDCFAEPVIGRALRDPLARNDGFFTAQRKRCRDGRGNKSGQKDFFSPATNWVVNLRGEQLLTFGDTIAISTPPGTTSGLLPLDGNCE